MTALQPIHFHEPESFLDGLDATVTGALLAAASDISVCLGPDRVVRDVAFGAPDLANEGLGDWRGRSFDEVVTAESRVKVAEMLGPSGPPGAVAVWRELNHPTDSGDDLPVRYRVVSAPRGEGWLLLGRDLRSVANLQSRLIGAQQRFEQDYARLRQIETRYLLLFRTAREGLLVVNPANGRIVEANERATELFERREEDLVRRRFPIGFDAPSTEAIDAMIATLRQTGRSEQVIARGVDGQTRLVVSASLFRGENQQMALIRVRPVEGDAQGERSGVSARVLELARVAVEAIVISDQRGRIIWANEALLELLQLAVPDDVLGEPLDRFFERPGVDLAVMLNNARRHGRLRLFAGTLRGAYGGTVDVDVSTVALHEGDEPAFGFVIRNATFGSPHQSEYGTLPRSAEQLKALIGRTSLKEIVSETTDVIERLCIETALGMTQDNRAAAADLLGLSRQSLYVKLRKHGVVDSEA